MVEIQEVPSDEVDLNNINLDFDSDDDEAEPELEAETDGTATESKKTTTTTTAITDEDGWQKLMGEDLIMKVIETKTPLSTPGNGSNDVQPQDAVLLDVVGRLAEDKTVTDGPIFQQIKGWLVVIGDGDILPAIEMAARFMQAGQTAQVWAHSKYAMGPGTRTIINNDKDKNTTTTKIPPYSNVMYTVTVVQKVMDTSRLNPYFTIQKALTKKNIANDIYQNEWCPPPPSSSSSKNKDDSTTAAAAAQPNCEMAMNRAIRLYQKAAKEMETLLGGTYFQQVEKDHPQRIQSQQILLDSLNNIVAVYLRQKEYHKAKQSAIEVLKQDSKNLKGLLRAAKASLLDPASTLEEVKAALDAAESEITYKNPNEEKELKKLKVDFKKFQNDYKQKTKAMFQNKLQTTKNALSSDDDPTSTTEENTTTTTRDGIFTQEQDSQSKNTNDNADTETNTDVQDGNENNITTNKKNGENDDDSATFWKNQLFTMFIQVILPFAAFLIYLFFKQTDNIARGGTIVGDGSSSFIAEESIHNNDNGGGTGSIVDESLNAEDVINLDL